MGKSNGPRISDYASLIQAGIDPITRLPTRLIDAGASKEAIKKALRIVDEQDATNRYTWFNLPCNLTSQELERMIYYKGQLAFFYLEEAEEFYFMPYALDGGIDVYGRFNKIHPVPMASDGSNDEKSSLAQMLSNKKYNCVYGLMDEEPEYDDMVNSCVLIHDYTKQLPQSIIPRQQLNDVFLDLEADCIPFMHTSLIAGTGVKGVRVADSDQAENVKEASRSIYKSALKSEMYVPMIGGLEFQDLANQPVMKAQDYMLAMQSIENLRLSTYGLDSGGLFEKKAHTTNQENKINNSAVGLVMQDGLSIRQNFCNIVNSIWGLGIWCEISQATNGVDNDGDGKAYETDEDAMNTGMGESSNDNQDTTI